MTPLDERPLNDALARAREAGREPVFWWRDDDAVTHTPTLDRLLALSERHNCPVTIAAVPGRVEPSLPARLASTPLAEVAVHGWIHRNHAPPSEKKAEFGPHRPLDGLAADARNGLAAARAVFGAGLVPVLVPPWNRIAPVLVARLPNLGYRGLSVFGPRGVPGNGLVTVNTHVDPIDWHASGRGLADPAILFALAAAAVARGEPLGLLTHHAAQTEAVWDFCEAFLARLGSGGARVARLSALVARGHPAVTEP